MTPEDKKRISEMAAAVAKRLADQGQIIEGGWQAYTLLAGLDKTSQTQQDEMRKAYWHGAQHLFGCIMSLLEAGQEATENDLRRMTLIHEELERWVAKQQQELDRLAAKKN